MGECEQELEDSDSDELVDTDDESAASSEADSDSSQGGWSFSNTRIGNFLSSVSGNKILERKDLEPVITPMHQMVGMLCVSLIS